MKTIYIVVRSGPEWNDIIACYEKENDAHIEARGLNARKGMRGTMEKLSTYIVIEKELR